MESSHHEWRPGRPIEPSERELLDHAEAGTLLDWAGDGPVDHEAMEGWGPERTVRAAVLRHLLVESQWLVHGRGVWLRGARIRGRVDLEAATVRCPLLLENCYFDGPDPINLAFATVSRVLLSRCRVVGGLNAKLVAVTKELGFDGSRFEATVVLDDADISGPLYCFDVQLTGAEGSALLGRSLKVGGSAFFDRLTTGGAITLSAANIAGFLTFRGAQLTVSDGDALDCTGIKVAAAAIFDQWSTAIGDWRFTATGAVRLLDADIGGQLSLKDAQLTGSEGTALVGDRMKVGANVMLDRVFANGAIRLSGADIAGQLSCKGAFLSEPDSKGTCLIGDGIRTGGNVYLSELLADGAIRLRGADIGGQLVFSGAKLAGSKHDPDALSADRLKVGSSASFDEGFAAAGVVRLVNANVVGQLLFSGAGLGGCDEQKNALLGDGMKVGGSLLLDQVEVPDGALRLRTADITGQLVCRGADLGGTDCSGNAFAGDAMSVGQEALFDEEFTAAGAVSVADAHIGGSLSLDGAQLAAPVALNAVGLHVDDQLHWAPRSPVEGLVDLERARVHRLDDDWSLPDAHWPPEGQLRLTGFAYEGFGGENPATWEQRLAWIRRSHTTGTEEKPAAFAAQPYEQLAQVYRESGHETAARQIGIARLSDLRCYGNLSRWRKFGNWLMDKTIRHGYQPLRAVVLLLTVYAAVLLVAWGAQHHDNMIVPAKDTKNIDPPPTALDCSAAYPCFYPAGYAVDVVVPIINLRQMENWRLNGQAPWGWAYIATGWIATGLGWAFTTLAVAGYTGLVRKT
jgi:hypothetical protein